MQGEAGGGRQGGQTEPEAEAAGERTAAGAQEVRAQPPEDQVPGSSRPMLLSTPVFEFSLVYFSLCARVTRK